MRKILLLAVAIGVLWIGLSPSKAADTLPAKYSDVEFWRMVTDFSEPGGSFQFENFVSNEISYQDILPELQRVTKPGGAYLGVAAEQNFTYIDVIQPKIAFILDIRRQNLVELLMYKALFEIAPDRADFVSKLFSRKRPAGLTAASDAEALFKAYDSVRADPQLYTQTLAAIKERLIKFHEYSPVGDDEQKIEYVFNVFFRGGPRMDYAYASSSPNSEVPSYYNLMVATDRRGKNWAYLNSEASYQRIREMQQKNLIVPLVADFAGPKTINAIAKYLKDHGAVLSVFYVSNVEDYLDTSWNSYSSNLFALPTGDSSFLIRFIPHANSVLGRILDLPHQWPGRYWH
ncbi:MAG TPA: hypothetical protein VK210_07130 [Terriglobia bacterium]|nr:hypothetical protein [Terriglobia bacterium]